MLDRALFARQKSKNDPGLIELDDEMLPCVYCKNDNLWYSFDGNYSSSSPQEKIKKKIEYEKRQLEYEETAERFAQARYEENLYWSRVRQDILKRDNHTCQLCGKQATTKFHVHHICKKKENGTDHYDNLITVCPGCHKRSDNKLYNPEWK